MTVSETAPSTGLRRQLVKLRNLAQPFFLPLDQASGWQFAGLLVALLFCVGGLVLVALTGLTELFEKLLAAFGFEKARTVGSHRQYVHPKLSRPFPVQPSGKDAKRYQVREFLELVEEHGLYIEP